MLCVHIIYRSICHSTTMVWRHCTECYECAAQVESRTKVGLQQARWNLLRFPRQLTAIQAVRSNFTEHPKKTHHTIQLTIVPEMSIFWHFFLWKMWFCWKKCQSLGRKGLWIAIYCQVSLFLFFRKCKIKVE